MTQARTFGSEDDCTPLIRFSFRAKSSHSGHFQPRNRASSTSSVARDGALRSLILSTVKYLSPHRSAYFCILRRCQLDPLVLPLRRTDDDPDPPRLSLAGYVRGRPSIASRLPARGSGIRHPKSQFDGRFTPARAGCIASDFAGHIVRNFSSAGSRAQPHLAIREQSLLPRKSVDLAGTRVRLRRTCLALDRSDRRPCRFHGIPDARLRYGVRPPRRIS